MLTEQELLEAFWYAVPNDLIGGYCIMTVNEPPSYGHGQEIADFCSEGIANYIVRIHNQRLEVRAK